MPIKSQLTTVLKQLKLARLASQWEVLADKSREEGWSAEEYLLELCRQELDAREERRLQRYLKEATLLSGKHLHDYDFSAVKGVTRDQVMHLVSQVAWVKRGDNLLLFGASGLGKTHLASGIGYKLLESGYRVKFSSASALVQQLQQSKKELKLTEALTRLDKYDVLIVDDIGYVQKTAQETSVLFELIAHRYERRSVVLTSNQSFEEWDKLFDDTVMTVAAIDRLVHHAQILHCEGESYRRKHVQSRRS